MKPDKPDDDSKKRIAAMFPPAISGLDIIESMEAKGQKQLVDSDCIPTDLEDVTEEELHNLGFDLGYVFEDDPMWRRALLPKGWTKVPQTGHSMWTHIYDETGKERFAIFYKAAYYDRRAFMRPTID